MAIEINLGKWSSVFAVPTSVVDEDIKLATPEQLKVLLYVLRHSNEKISERTIAAAIGVNAEDIDDYLLYWKENGVLSMNINTKISSEPVPEVSQANEPEKDTTKDFTENENEIKKSRQLSRPTKPDSIFVAQRLNNDRELADLVNEVQEVMGKPLSSGDTATLVMLHDTDGLPCDVLLMLVNYCKYIGKDNMRYIEKMAITWSDKDITTIERAEHMLEEMEASGEAWNTVARIFGISNSGSPTKAQKENAYRWVNEWGFGEDMLREAYERCVNYKGTFSLSYTNGILKSWQKNNLNSIRELTAYEEKNQVKSKPNAAPKQQASYNIDEYEDFSMFD